jgi:hypothetical protein
MRIIEANACFDNAIAGASLAAYRTDIFSRTHGPIRLNDISVFDCVLDHQDRVCPFR